MSEILSDLPVTDLLPPGRHGRADGAPGVIAHPLSRLAVATLVACKGAVPRITEAALAAFGVALADAPKVSFTADIAFIGTGPGRWLVTASQAPEALMARLTDAFGDGAALTDQSDANLMLDLYGPAVGETLAKLVPVDLDPSVFRPGDAAATLVALMPLTFWQLNDSPAYRFAIPRSFAPAFLRALASAAASAGLEMAGPARG
ncbi:sarcosine oxidase subunit gamma [Aquabacter cavernae]|uniref:sarcosine oxidase subunit gamma n=1 Tax=Aquabacter cavernae TaxID=2496029 RepID=UPI0013DEEF4F|nr:sarcosine oxidase subunit gamma family protein [Aquabacter cavernae]